MNGEGVANLESKVNSGEANFSTSESTHSKPPILSSNTHQSQEKQSLRLLNLSQLELQCPLTDRNDYESDFSSRLFTFMDQKEAERKIIQNFIFRNSNKEKESKKSKCKSGIMKMIEESKKKRDQFLNKIIHHQPPLRQDKSQNKLQRISKSKTPRQLPLVENKYDTLQPRSRSKTPKMQNTKRGTPRNQIETKMFRAKSNLDKEHVKCIQNQLSKQDHENKQSPGFAKQKHQSIPQENQSFIARQLLKKKKQLQKQLSAINQSLLLCKKNGKDIKNKLHKQSKKGKDKKSIVKLLKY